MIVVTGATGHIGNVLIRELIKRRQIVRALVMPNDDYRPLTSLEVEIVRGDVTDLKRLESAFSGAENYPPAPERTYYRLTEKGIEAGDELWSNPLFTLYPEIGPSHMKMSD